MSKVTRLMTHMDEAVEWLEQKRIDVNAQLAASQASDYDDIRVSSKQRTSSKTSNKQIINIQDREQALKSKDGHRKTATDWDNGNASPPMGSSGPNSENFRERKQSEP